MTAYKNYSSPAENLIVLLRAQEAAGATSALPEGAEPLDVLVAKSIFNAQELGTGGSVISLPTGGSAGQTLVKQSGTDGDATWASLTGAFVSIADGGGYYVATTAESVLQEIGAELVAIAGDITAIEGDVSTLTTAVAGKMTDPMTTAGDIIIRNGGNSTVRLAAGTNTHVLTMTGGVPAWAAAASGFADPMTTAGDIIIRNAGNTTTRLAAGTEGYVLTITSGVPAWAAAGGGGGSGTVNSGASGLLAYYPGAGTTVDDAARLAYSSTTGALSITSLASQFNVLALDTTTAGFGTYVQFKMASTSYSFIGPAWTTNALVGGSSTGDLVVRTQGQPVYFTTDSGTAVGLSLEAANAGISWAGSTSGTVPVKSNLLVFPASGLGQLELQSSATNAVQIAFKANNYSAAVTSIGQAGAANSYLNGTAVGDLVFFINGNSQRVIFTTAGAGNGGLTIETNNNGISWAQNTSGILPVKSNLNVFPATGLASLYIKAAANESTRLIFQPNNDGPAVVDIGAAGATNALITGSAVGDLCLRINGNSQRILMTTVISRIDLLIDGNGQVSAERTTASTSTVTGALISKGGLGVAGAVFTGDAITTGAPSGGTAAAWKFGTVATVNPTSPNRTIELDVNGTRYFLHAKTTND